MRTPDEGHRVTGVVRPDKNQILDQGGRRHVISLVTGAIDQILAPGGHRMPVGRPTNQNYLVLVDLVL